MLHDRPIGYYRCDAQLSLSVDVVGLELGKLDFWGITECTMLFPDPRVVLINMADNEAVTKVPVFLRAKVSVHD